MVSVTVSLCIVTVLFFSFKRMPWLLSQAVDRVALVSRLIVLTSSRRRGGWYSGLGLADNDVGSWVPLSFDFAGEKLRTVVGVDASK